MEAPQIKIDPYQSSVPIVPLTQMPEQDLQAQQSPRIYSKTGGIAQFADTAMKGMLKGLQMKEERKFKTAEAVMQAQDAGIGAARKNYEDLLTTKGAFEADGKTPKAETQAAYQAWSQAVDAAAAQRQAFAIPDQKGKGDKSKKKDKNQPDQTPAGGGFGAGLKQFFERNPHIVPELAIIGMKAQVTPYGQMAPEQQESKMKMDALQRQEANQKVADAARATYDKYAGRPNLTPQEQSDFENAKVILTPITASQKFQILVDPQKQQHNVPVGTEIPEGWKVYEKPLSSQVPKAGTEQEYTTQALKGYGYTNDTAPPALLKYIHDSWQYKAAQTSSSSQEHLVTDPTTNQLVAVKTGSSMTRGAAEPKPPAGFAPVGADGQPLKEVKPGKMTAAPGAPAANSAPAGGRGKMTTPPGVRNTGVQSASGTKWNVSTAEGTRKAYEGIENKYHAELVSNAKNAADPAARAVLDKQSLEKKEAEKASVVLSRAAQIRSVGGDPWKHQAKDGKGNTYGTMDGINWVNVQTGYPYQEQ